VYDFEKIITIMSVLRKYEIMILLTEEFNDSELKTWVFNYAKNLRKFSVSDISVISRGKHNLAYSINNRTKGNYIQLNFSSMPKYINNFSNILKLDSHVLRSSVFNKQT
jgi:ribosomal protein S6